MCSQNGKRVELYVNCFLCSQMKITDFPYLKDQFLNFNLYMRLAIISHGAPWANPKMVDRRNVI